MRHNPPKGNVRRFGSNGKNTRSEFVNRFGELVQTESWLEVAWVLINDRKVGVRGYTSQPRRYKYIDETGQVRSHVPDFRLIQYGKPVEIHEVTVSERLARNVKLQHCYAATADICKAEGEVYVINTEKDLPSETEVVNLWYLLFFRPTSFHIPDVTDHVYELMDAVQNLHLDKATQLIASNLKMEESDVFGSLMHSLWIGKLETDLNYNLMDRGDICSGILLSIPASKDV